MRSLLLFTLHGSCWSGILTRDFRFYVNNEHHLVSIWRYAKGHPFDAGNRVVKEFVKLGFCFLMSEIVITGRENLTQRKLKEEIIDNDRLTVANLNRIKHLEALVEQHKQALEEVGMAMAHPIRPCCSALASALAAPSLLLRLC